MSIRKSLAALLVGLALAFSMAGACNPAPQQYDQDDSSQFRRDDDDEDDD